MERRKAVIAAAIISATFVAGVTASAATSVLTSGRNDNVGNLQPTQMTVRLDPTSVTSAEPVPSTSYGDASSSDTDLEREADELPTRGTEWDSHTRSDDDD